MVSLGKSFALVFVALFLTSLAVLPPVTVKAQFQSDIIIDIDGSITPSKAPIQQAGTTYTLTNDVVGIITVQVSNIVLDGNGKTVSSISLNQVLNVTVRNLIVAMNDKISGIGVSLNNASNCLIYNNTVTGFWSVQYMNGIDFGGIYVIGGNSNVLAKNIVKDSLEGMTFINTSQNVITQNNFTSKTEYTSLIDFVRGSNNTVYHNNFVSIASKARVYYSTDSWDNGSASGGNYWSDYNGNGVYVIDQNNIDNYPLNKIFDIYQQSILTLLTPTPAVSEFSSWTIPLLVSMMLVAAGLLVYHKKHKAV
jgi:parallel beta-helix repeat protein